MGSPYTSVSVSGYNSNPPSDDGSATAANEIDWATVKTKIGDPLNTFASAVDSAVSSAFGKVVGGGGVTSYSTSSTVQSSDQGKLIVATAGSITITTPDATTVTSPFVFGFLNNSTGTVTVDGNGSQTVNGNTTVDVPAGAGFMVFTDGSNWFTTGQQGTLTGAQLGYGEIINGTLTESNASNAATFALKTLAGSDPSSTDPVLICFRNATAGNGNYVYRTVTAALSLTISSGSNLGVSTNSQAFRVWLVLFDDGGTIRMGAINCLQSGQNIYGLGGRPIASSTAEGGAGGADSAHAFYTATAVTSKPYAILGYANYESGLATAGSWNVSPDTIQLYGPGVPLPGQVITDNTGSTNTTPTGTTIIPLDNTVPQNTEGDEYLTISITPSSKANLIFLDTALNGTHSVGAQLIQALFIDSTANALAVAVMVAVSSTSFSTWKLNFRHQAQSNSGGNTYKIRAGGHVAGTFYLNSTSVSGMFNGTLISYMRVQEIMA